jgi:hypothetical protein
MALGGRAAWVGSRAPDALPGGFAWTVVPVDDVPRLPEAAFRLVVHQGDGSPGGAAPAGLARILDEGGILVTAVDGDVSPDPHLRLVDLDRAVEPWLAVCRRA